MPEVNHNNGKDLPIIKLSSFVAIINRKLDEVIDIENLTALGIVNEVLHGPVEEVAPNLPVVEGVLLDVSGDREHVHEVIREQILGAALSVEAEELNFVFIHQVAKFVNDELGGVADHLFSFFQILGVRSAAQSQQNDVNSLKNQKFFV